MGTQWTGVVLVAASGPLLVGITRDATGGYAVSFAIVTMLFLAAAAVIVASGQAEQSRKRRITTDSLMLPDAES